MKTHLTLGEFIIQNQKDFQHSTGELSRLLSAIKLASKLVNREVNKAGLVDDILGDMGQENIQGEVQKKLDVFANDLFIRALTQRDVVCGIASEENEFFIPIASSENSPNSKYVVLIDPLDSPVGTPVQLEDFLQEGNKQVAAGYVVYGLSTMLVYTTGHGVNGFTLDPSIGTYYLSHPNMQYPKDGTIYSINEGNYVHFPQGVKDYLKYCQALEGNRPYTSRYIGSLVSDFHRNMLKGGIYIYPSGTRTPRGKLRLLYECNPMAFLTEQAGGKASDGYTRIMDIRPTELHQRVPFFCGSENMVKKVEEFMAKYPNDKLDY